MKIADAPGESIDYLVGKTNLILDKDTLKRLEDIDSLSDDAKNYILFHVVMLVRDFKNKKAYAHNNNMRLQIIQDGKGKVTGVYIPISEWKELKKQYKDLEVLEYEEPTKEQLLQELKEAVNELKLIEQGKLKARPAKDLLNEL